MVAAGGSTALYSSSSDSGWPMRSRVSWAMSMAYIGNRRISVRLQDVAERDPPDLRARIDPELVVVVVQHVVFRLVVDDHRAVVRGPDDDRARPGRPA